MESFSPNQPTGLIWASSRDVRPLFVVPFSCNFFKASFWPSDCGRIKQAAARWQDQPGSSPLLGSTRQQTVGRINQVADRGDGDKDKDEEEDKDEDEIPSYPKDARLVP